MTPLALQYAREAAHIYQTSVAAIAGNVKDRRASAGRSYVWHQLRDKHGLSLRKVAAETGHNHCGAVHFALRKGLPDPDLTRPAPMTEARRAVLAAAAAMLAKHQRELADRY